jgi:hypothetical protein
MPCQSGFLYDAQVHELFNFEKSPLMLHVRTFFKILFNDNKPFALRAGFYVVVARCELLIEALSQTMLSAHAFFKAKIGLACKRKHYEVTCPIYSSHERKGITYSTTKSVMKISQASRIIRFNRIFGIPVLQLHLLTFRSFLQIITEISQHRFKLMSHSVNHALDFCCVECRQPFNSTDFLM